MKLNKEKALEVCQKHSITAATVGYCTNVIPEDEWMNLVEQILLLMQPNNDTPPQLNKHDVIGWLELEKQKPTHGQYVAWRSIDEDKVWACRYADGYLFAQSHSIRWCPLPTIL